MIHRIKDHVAADVRITSYTQATLGANESAIADVDVVAKPHLRVTGDRDRSPNPTAAAGGGHPPEVVAIFQVSESVSQSPTALSNSQEKPV
jgi:hypothetical protein